MTGAGDNESPLPEQDFKLRVISGNLVRKASYHQVDLAIAQFALLERRWIAKNDVQRYTWMILQ